MILKKIRQDGLTGKFLSEIQKGYIFADQDVLNVTCLNKIRYLPVKYNIATFVFDLPDRKPYLIYSQSEFDEAKNNPVIIHYAAPYKPWLYYGLKYDAQWYKYFIISVFKSQILKRKNGKFRILSDEISSKMSYTAMVIRVFLMSWETRGLFFTLRKVKN